eukprot:TRINITY_DN1735_c0_g1_i3.p1 TRINITY_DN1735_c0_g1~~TRINITY_DN1735_c0_g1_i3.p1  ORF type:complete len:531 (-),score=54.14 TRINITY_DN1735_c0_g1_i3:186-1778(-)
MLSKTTIIRKASVAIKREKIQQHKSGHQKHVIKLGRKQIRRNVATPQTETQSQVETDVTKKSEDEIFQWTKQWYPVHAVIHLDPTRPTGIQLLGKDLVIWRDGGGNWVCFEDQCPHRLVPLSEGRLETDGTLQCSYHGWRFNGKGECVKIPQAEPEMAEKLCQNERAHAKTYPTQEKYGLLWIWGESGADAHLESLSSPPIVTPVLESTQFEFRDWLVRDMPYSHETLLENVVDPAHVTVTHHGRSGQDRNNAVPLYSKLETPMHAYTGFKFFYSSEKNKLQKENLEGNSDSVQFIPPNFVQYSTMPTGKRTFDSNMVLISTPITKGKCRLFQKVFFHGEDGQKAYKTISSIPKWLFHLGANTFFQQDNVFLLKQEKVVRNEKMPKPVTKAYYTPTISDIGVNELHKWLTMHAQGGVPYPPEAISPQNDNGTDTYNFHTKICTFCMGALQNFRKIQVGAWVACAICATCAICSALIQLLVPYNVFEFVVQLPQVKVFVFGVFSLLFGAIGNYVNQTIIQFYKTEYTHADH